MGERVGFIGLGTMGRPFAENIVGAGFDLVVHDLAAEALAALQSRGATVAASPRQVAEQCSIVSIAVPHEAEVEAVLNGAEGLVAGAHPGLTVVIHSSLHPTNMRRMAGELAARGIDVLDAQMSGGNRGVRDKSLLFMIGGTTEVLERCRPVLETTGQNIFLMGPVGAGALAKVAQNMMTAMHLAVATEGFRFAEGVGIDPQMFQSLVHVSSAQSHIADDFLQGWGARNTQWNYYEVLHDALSLGRELDVPLPAAALAQQLLATALRK